MKGEDSPICILQLLMSIHHQQCRMVRKKRRLLQGKKERKDFYRWFEDPGNIFLGSTAVAFGFEDAPATAKVLSDFAKDKDALKIKGGFLGSQLINSSSVTALADLPPLPIMRGMLLGTILAPATQLARILAEPGRQVAAVIKAYADKDTQPAA